MSIFLPGGYVSGSMLPDANAILGGTTYQSLGVTSGDYTWSWGIGQGADSITLRIVKLIVSNDIALFSYRI